jgi:transposase-like protein
MRKPPYCPNPECEVHDYEAAARNPRFWIKKGVYRTAVSGQVQRFICSRCGRGFSERTCSIDYYTKRTLDYAEILRAGSASESVSSIARHLGCSLGSVQNRQDRLGRNCLAMQARLLAGHALIEDLCADGFESFDRSQFFPNAINILVGSQSQFLYGLTHSTLRRKGRMTQGQRKKRDKLDAIFQPPRDALTRSFSSLLSIIDPMWKRDRLPALVLRTDEQPAYPRAIQRVSALRRAREEQRFIHEAYSSRIVRSLTNPLFPVNYYDRELRKDVAAYRRESTCFTRNVSNGLLRFTHHMIWHNYEKSHRIVSTSSKPHSHAVMAGLEKSRIQKEYDRLFVDRAFLSHLRLSDEGKRIWLKLHPTPLKRVPEYCPRFARVGEVQGS